MTPKQLFGILWAVVGIIVLYLIVSAALTRQATGLLSVTGPDKNASFSVSQLKAQAQIVGVGSAKVRLHPGVYQVSANDGNRQATALVTIEKQGSSSVNLNPTKKSKLPSVDDIAFSGTDSLIGHGLSSSQLQSLKDDFFKFNSSANKVSINSNTVSPGPRNLHTPTATFSLTFKATVDSTSYNAKVLYSFGDSVNLILQDNHGTQVFDSSFVSAS